jgi:hypothetical protein
MISQMYSIERIDKPISCESCAERFRHNQLAIRRDPIHYDIQYWHFACALLNGIITEYIVVRLARSFKGSTR